jgi:hypothetical protein
MHFGRVKVGDRYSVSPEATLGPTPSYERRKKKKEREKEQRLRAKKEASN